MISSGGAWTWSAGINARASPNPAAGSTVLISGVPGAGKTVLMTHLRTQWDGEDDRPLGVELDLEDLRGADVLAEALKYRLQGRFSRLAERFLPSLGVSAGGAFRLHQETLGRVMAAFARRSRAPDEITALLKRHGGARPAWMPAAEAFRELLAKGLIQAHPKRFLRYTCPIPSMLSFCAAGAGNGLHRAALLGDAEELRECLAEGDDPNALDALGRTPLHIACGEEWPEIRDMLFESGADPEIRDAEGKTPAGCAPVRPSRAESLAAEPRPDNADGGSDFSI